MTTPSLQSAPRYALQPRLAGLVWSILLVAALVSALSSQVAAQSSDYRIGPGDVLKITVYGHDDLSRAAVVAPDGRMPFPLVGDIEVGGLTPTELEARLRQTLGKDYLVDPQVSVAVQEY